jgi:hypothetical protein
MKYLYMIFRLFRCPHKWREFGTTQVTRLDLDGVERAKAHVYINKCRRCGTFSSYRLDV